MPSTVMSRKRSSGAARVPAVRVRAIATSCAATGSSAGEPSTPVTFPSASSSWASNRLPRGRERLLPAGGAVEGTCSAEDAVGSVSRP